MQIINKLIEKLGALPAERAGVYLSSDSKMEIVVYNVETGEIKRNAGVCADGISEINGVHHIFRGYEHVVEKFSGLGANIKIVDIDEAVPELRTVPDESLLS